LPQACKDEMVGSWAEYLKTVVKMVKISPVFEAQRHELSAAFAAERAKLVDRADTPVQAES